MLRLADIMSTEVVTVSPDLGLRDAMDLFVAEHISGAPVVSGHQVLGVVSTTDLLAFAAGLPEAPPLREPPSDMGERETDGEDDFNEAQAAVFTEMWEDAGADVVERAASPGSPEWNVLAEHTVSEAMTSSLCSLPPETAVPMAAEYMKERGVHRVLVMDKERLLGIVTTSDISGAVAEHKLTERRFVFGKPQVRADGSHW